MSEPEDKPADNSIPAWQRGQTGDDNATDSGPKQDREDKLEVARRFLEDDLVKAASHEKKISFLQSKGVEEEDIQKLLGQPSQKFDEVAHVTQDIKSDTAPPQPSTTPTTGESNPSTPNDRAPIVTYPEFLTKPQRPPPLVTTNAIFNTLYGFIGLSTLLYGTSKYLVGPMVDNLTEARLDFHETTHKKLDLLVAELEKNVSVIPAPKTDAATSDESDEAEDPTEMFHRDIGTQTSFPSAPTVLNANKAAEPESIRQTDRLQTLIKSLTGLKEQLRSESQDMEDTKAVLDVFRDDLDGMIYGGQSDFIGGYDFYNKTNKAEPDDEIRKVRDNIRRVKGVLLSTRSFPASTR